MTLVVPFRRRVGVTDIFHIRTFQFKPGTRRGDPSNLLPSAATTLKEFPDGRNLIFGVGNRVENCYASLGDRIVWIMRMKRKDQRLKWNRKYNILCLM